MAQSFSEVADIAGVADGGTDGPAAVAALDVSQSAGFVGVPDINAAGSLAGSAIATAAGGDFVEHSHRHGVKLVNIIMCPDYFQLHLTLTKLKKISSKNNIH